MADSSSSPSTPDPSNPPDQDEDDDLGIEDPEEYLRSRRLKEIYDAKENVRTHRREIDLMISDPDYPQVDRVRGARLYRTAVEDFITTLEPLMTHEEPETGERYWCQESLGSVTVDPPQSVAAGREPTGFNGYTEVVDPAEPQSMQFRGLESIVEAPRPLRFSFTATVRDIRAGEEFEEVETVNRVIPWRILVKAHRLGTLFLSEIGVEIEISDKTGGASFDWEDIAPNRLKEDS